MRIKKHLLKILPYSVSILAGLLFWFIGLKLSGDIKTLFIGLAAVLLAIPLVYLFYERSHRLSQKKLNKEIFDYAKMQVDIDVLSIVNQLQKAVYPLEERDFSPRGISKFLTLEKTTIKKILSKNEYLGFQVFKTWEVSENSLHDALKNPYMLQSLENEQIISIISIIKGLRLLEGIKKSGKLYEGTDKRATSYIIKAGKEISKENIEFPDRQLLLKDLGDNKFLVADFGDFKSYDADKLLQIFVVNQQSLEAFSDTVFYLIREIANWVKYTGGEFVIDTKMFRLSYKVTLDKND